MGELHKLHLLVGVKAEQSLRDSVRAVIEQTEDDSESLELAPVGRKDWVAGIRIDETVEFGKLGPIASEVLGHLIAIDSRQRIRRENVRAYVVQPPVPVFKDPEEPPLPAEPPQSEPESSSATCPICGRTVHSYNLQHDTSGRAVGCYICRGDPGRARS